MATVTKVYGVEDCKIAQLLTDPAAGVATYDSNIDVPGIKTVQISGTIDNKELRGDNRLLDSNSTLTNITVAISNAKLSMDVLAVLLGGTSGANSFDLNGSDTLNYFKLESRTPTGGGDDPAGDVHFVLHKLILDAFPEMGHEEEDYRIVSFSAKASPLISNGDWLSIDSNVAETLITEGS